MPISVANFFLLASNPAVPPSAPSVAVSTASGTDTITYQGTLPGNNPIAGYALYAGISPGAENTSPYATNNGAADGSFTHPAPAQGTSNYYVVKAFDVAATPNYSDASTELSTSTATAATPPNAPVITVTAAGGLDTIFYQPATAGANPIGGYKLYTGASSGGEATTPIGTITGSGGASFVNPSAAAGSATYYLVKAFDVASPANYSVASNEVSSVITAPSAPVVAVSTTSLLDTITYQSATAGSFPVSGYQLFVGSVTGGQSSTPYAMTNSPAAGVFHHPSAAPGSGYFYTVKAFDTASSPNFSAASTEHSVVIAAPTTPPSATTITISSSSGTDTITYQAASVGANPIAGYSLFVAAVAGGETNAPAAINMGGSSGVFAHISAAPGDTLYYQVKAFDNAVPPNYAVASNEVSHATPANLTVVSQPVSGLLSPAVFWLFVPAPGNYLLSLGSDGTLSAVATGLPAGNQVVTFAAEDVYTVTMVALRNGLIGFYTAPYSQSTP